MISSFKPTNMTREVPFETSYGHIRNVEKAAFICLIISAVLTIINWVIPNHIDLISDKLLEYFKDKIKTVNYVSTIVYILTNIFVKIAFNLVEKRKRDDLIDNSFDTNFLDENTLGYYNNLEMAPGIKKLALNSFESSFHTENTLKYMLFRKFYKLMTFGLIFVFSIFSAEGSNTIRLLFEISIPIILLNDVVVIGYYYFNVININKVFTIQFTNIGSKELTHQDIGKILMPTIDYFSIKAWANTNLDSKIFKNHNEEFSKKWNIRKAGLSLNI
jgi:hypothetical protein